MKFREAVYLIAVSCFCGLIYLFVTSMFGAFPMRSASPVIAIQENEVAHFVNDGEISDNSQTKTDKSLPTESQYNSEIPQIVIAVVVCAGDNRNDRIIEQAITSLKSAILFSKRTRIKIIAFADESSRELFAQKVLELLVESQKYLRDTNRVSLEIHPTWFPPEKENVWSQLYAPCSTQRLFIPTMLPNVDALIYLDTDTLVLNDLEYLWHYFKRMSNSQYIAMVPEHEEPGNGWYNLEATFPYYGSRGLNAGVMLMNLTRMREVGFQEKLYPILTKYEGNLPWGDQDILNIFLHNNTDAVYQLPCKYNYRLNHCKCDYNDNKSCNCKSADETGVSIFHGNKGIFYKSGKEYAIPSAIYRTFSKHNLMNTTPKDLLQALNKNLLKLTTKSKRLGQTCENLQTILLWNLLEYAQEYELEDHDDPAEAANNNNGDGPNSNKNDNDEEKFVDFSLENRLEFME